MKKLGEHILSAEERLWKLVAARGLAERGVGAELEGADSPRAFAAYKRLIKSIDFSRLHAYRQMRKEEDEIRQSTVERPGPKQ